MISLILSRALVTRSSRPILRRVPLSAVSTKCHIHVLVVGGGCGGCSIAAKLSKAYGEKNVIIIEPSDDHYYQPMWTLVGGGVKTFAESVRPMQKVLPKGVTWIKDHVSKFEPSNNRVLTKSGKNVAYDIMIVAVGLQLNYDAVPGLNDALRTPEVCSIYSPIHVQKTFSSIKNFTAGNAVFTFPNTPVKCAGAPQKIMYLTEHYFHLHSKREQAKVMYFTSLPVIFGVPKYANELMKIVKQRDIQLHLRHNLIKVDPYQKKAIFENLDKPGSAIEIQYNLLHVAPPMGPADVVRNSPLSDSTGFINVNKETLQHPTFSNVFGIGDCTNLPTSKTMAAVAGQVSVLFDNVKDFIAGRTPSRSYDGYTSCPLVTAYGRCILAEFDYNSQPLETFPIDQGKERRLFYYMKKDVLPQLYWNLMLRGNWNGPRFIRKCAHLGMTR